MNVKSGFSFFVFSLLLCVISTAQQNNIGPTFGSAFHLSAKAAGYQIGLEYQKKIDSSGDLGIEMSQVFLDGRGVLPKNISEQHIILRDYTQYEPLGLDTNAFLWDESAFPSLRLPSKPNRYYQFNIGLKYLRKLLKKGDHQGLNAGLGVVLSYRDEMELLKLTPVRHLKFISPPIEVSDVLVPLFGFKTFLDIALAPEFNYQVMLGQKILLGCRGQFFYYFSSNDLLLTTSASCRIIF